MKSRRRSRRRAVILTSRTIAFSALTLSALLIASYLLFPVKEIRIEGNRMVPDSELLQHIPERTSLPLIGARDLEEDVDSNPWVEGVSVNKDWDSGTVVVEVEEREPALKASFEDGGQMVVSGDGTRLPGMGGVSMPEVKLDRQRLESIRQSQAVLEENGVEVESVNSIGASGVELTVQRPQGPEARVVFSGEIEPGQARVLDGLLRERPEARYFDLRTPERVVVGGSTTGESTTGSATG